jgi:OOP family OmpA-OmpF porin
MRVWRIPDVLFETGKSAVTPGLREEIGEFSRVLLEQDPHAALRVEGHTDASGTREFNQRLSDERAAAVRNALMNAGIAPQRITAVGLAETRPVASNETVEGRARNRRVDIVIQ